MNKFVKVFDVVLLAILALYLLLHVMLGFCEFHVVDVPLLSTRNNPFITYTALTLGILMGVRSLMKAKPSHASRKQQPIRYFLLLAALFIWQGINNLVESSILSVLASIVLILASMIAIVTSARLLRSVKEQKRP